MYINIHFQYTILKQIGNVIPFNQVELIKYSSMEFIGID
jgi:hypothetical protein